MQTPAPQQQHDERDQHNQQQSQQPATPGRHPSSLAAAHELRSGFFASSDPRRWHLAASGTSQPPTASQIMVLLRRQHMFDLRVVRCQQLLQRFSGLESAEDAAAMFQLLRTCQEAFDQQPGAEQDVVELGHAVPAVAAALFRLGASMAHAKAIRRALPPCEVDYDAFTGAVLQLAPAVRGGSSGSGSSIRALFRRRNTL